MASNVNLGSINIHSITHLFDFVRNTNEDVETAASLVNLIKAVGDAQTSQDKKAASLKIVKFYQSTQQALLANYEDLEEDVQEITPLIQCLTREATPANLIEVIGKVKEVIKEHFPDLNSVSSVLQARIKNSKPGDGLIELHALVFQRPDLQTDLCNGGKNREFLKTFASPLKTFLESFAGGRNGVPKETGQEMLTTLAERVLLHEESMRDLYEDTSVTAQFVHTLIVRKNSKEKINELYDQLKQEIIKRFDKENGSSSSSGPTGRDFFDFLNAQARASVLRNPQVKENQAKIDRQILAGLGRQKDHGDGSLLSGYDARQGAHYYGSGINIENTFRQPIDPTSKLSCETHIRNPEIRKQVEAFGRAIVDGYYKEHKLLFKRLVVHGSVLEEIPVYDPIDRALLTIHTVADYEVEQYAKTFPMGLDAQQKLRYKPVAIENVVRFGIEKGIFSAAEVQQVLQNRPS